jgi:putative ABC transport system ATP-binding protein
VLPEVNPCSRPTIEAVDLRRSLPLGGETVNILNGVSFVVRHKEWVALTGPSGSGKSTLLGIVAGLDSPSSGRIMLDGVDVTTLPERELARIRNTKVGVVFQSFNLIPSLTAQENVEAPLYVRTPARQAREAAKEMLDLVGLQDRRHHLPHQLSGGQQQRVAIARALVTRPAVLVADEPTGNLDTATGAQVLDLFARVRDEVGVTLFVVTHDPDVSARADRQLHLVDGRLSDPDLVTRLATRSGMGAKA